MKRIIGFICFILVGVNSLCGQQLPQSSSYAWNPFQWNIAAAGSEQTPTATVGYRSQWNGLTGAPETQMLNVHTPLDIARSGVGLRIQNDAIGAHRITVAQFGYSYHAIQKGATRASIALGVGMEQYQLNGQALRAPDGTYQELAGVFIHNDDFLSESVLKSNGYTSELGIWVQNRALQLGVAVAQLISAPIALETKKKLKIKRAAHANFFVSYKHQIRTHFELRPSVWVQTNADKLQSNIALQIGYKQNIFVGMGSRGIGTQHVESLTYLVGGRVNPNLVLIYSYDSVTLPLSSSASGTHELVLRYQMAKPLGSGKLPPIIYNPRYL